MAKYIVVIACCVVTIFVFVQFWGILHIFLEDLSMKSSKIKIEYDASIRKAMEQLRGELDTKEKHKWSQHTEPLHQNQEEMISYRRAQQNTEDKKLFFVITTIYNPASYRSRNHLYHNFVRHMNETGAQLVTIECIFPSLNQTKFQVTEANNPWHIQLKSESVYWMKENLINIAVSRLPPHAKWVCWLDAEIEFENSNWVELTIKVLEKYIVIQMFETVHFLGPAPENEILRSDNSFGYSVVHNKNIDSDKYKNRFHHPGYGWAISVDAFRVINGLPHYCIAGSRDYLFAYSLINGKNISLGKNAKEMDPAYVKMVLDNMKFTFSKLKELVHSKKSMRKEIVGYLPETIRHNWHGSKKNRHYVERWKILSDNKFNFQNDVTVTQDGLFQFSPKKPGLQKSFVAYFEARHEDSNKTRI